MQAAAVLTKFLQTLSYTLAVTSTEETIHLARILNLMNCCCNSLKQRLRQRLTFRPGQEVANRPSPQRLLTVKRRDKNHHKQMLSIATTPEASPISGHCIWSRRELNEVCLTVLVAAGTRKFWAGTVCGRWHAVNCHRVSEVDGFSECSLRSEQGLENMSPISEKSDGKLVISDSPTFIKPITNVLLENDTFFNFRVESSNARKYKRISYFSRKAESYKPFCYFYRLTGLYERSSSSR